MDPKTAGLTSITAVATTLLCLSIYQAIDRGNARIASAPVSHNTPGQLLEIPVALQQIQAELRDLRLRIASLERTSQEFSAFSGSEAPPWKDLTRRIELVEDAVLNQVPPGLDPGTEGVSERGERIAADMAKARDTAISGREVAAESEFDRDDGIPLGGYSAAIGDALQVIDTIDVQNMDCRDTICKITYRPSEPASADDAQSDNQALMDALLENSGGRAVDIRYATDGFGNDVMYVQLRQGS